MQAHPELFYPEPPCRIIIKTEYLLLHPAVFLPHSFGRNCEFKANVLGHPPVITIKKLQV